MKELLIALCLTVPALTSYADIVIHKEKSLYRNIIVNQKADKRCLVFSVKREMRNQTCIDTKNPNRIVFAYVQMTFSGLMANPDPKRALMIGVGGGTISNVLLDVFPELEIDLVEVDQAVVNVAREYFDFVENDRTKMHVVDGRVFTRRAVAQDKQYDLIILDAFTGEYIPEHMMTLEFMQDIAALLTENGVVISNTFEGSALYDYESATYQAAFGDLLNLKMPHTGNRVIVATASPLPSNQRLAENAHMLQPKFDKYEIVLRNYIARFDRTPDWNPDTRPLTDQYSPANLLRSRKR